MKQVLLVCAQLDGGEPNNNDWGNLVASVSSEYGVADLVDPSGNKYTFKEAMKYMRGGQLKSNYANGLWENGTGTLNAAKANEIQFNLLPMGEIADNTGTTYVSGNGVGYRIWLLGSSKDRFQNNPTADSNGINALRHQSKSGAFGAIRCVRMEVPNIAIETPYPTEIEIKQIASTEKEVERHKGRMKRFDHVPTGFFIQPGKTLKINLQTLNAAADKAVPQVVIGTRGQMPAMGASTGSQRVDVVNLVEGENTINVVDGGDAGGGGFIYFRYVTHTDNQPSGSVKVTFMENGEHERGVHYVYGTTTDDEFIKMMSEYSAPEVLYTSDEMVVVASKDAAYENSMNIDKNLWFEHLHKLMEIESDISGMDDNDPNPLHHRMKKGEIRHLLVQTRFNSPNASDWRTAYPGPSRYLKPFNTPGNSTNNASWQVAHEVGHQHQQVGYLIPQAGESTVNIYSFKAAAYFDKGGSSTYVRTPDNKLEIFHRTYMKLPDAERVYEMNGTDLQTIIEGVNRDELRMVPWELQFYMFGDEFFKRLHRITREENATNGGTESGDRKKAYLITRASLISGYDLRKYYAAWGIKLENPVHQRKIDQAIEDANLPEPPRIDELAYISGTKFVNGEYAGWLPLSIENGITTSVPENWDWDSDNIQPTNQLASIEKYCDYSTKTGEITDERDGKVYPYKTYGDKNWFMKNLDWDGYNGVSEDTRGTVGVYTPEDPEGEAYGRFYPTYAGNSKASTWCPKGWKYATKTDMENLGKLLADMYNMPTSEVAKCMKCGGDRNEVMDGLWAIGTGSYDEGLANEVGFNILPAGVYNTAAENYERATDSEGWIGAFVTEGWYHSMFTTDSDQISYTTRNTRHSASVRCTQPAATRSVKTLAVSEEDVTLSVSIYPNPVSAGDAVYVDASKMTNEFFNDAKVYIYSYAGANVKEQAIKDAVTTVTMPVTQGIYILKVVSKTYNKEFKVMVK